MFGHILKSTSGPINTYPINWGNLGSLFTLNTETPNDPDLGLYTIDVLVSKNGGTFTKFQLFPASVLGAGGDLLADLTTAFRPYLNPIALPILTLNTQFTIGFYAAESGNYLTNLGFAPFQTSPNTYSFKLNWYKNNILVQSTSLLIWNSPAGHITYTP